MLISGWLIEITPMGKILFSVVLSLFGFHPIHVSITDVVLDTNRKALEFTSKVFLDDIEAHIRLEKSEPFLDITNLGEGRTLDDLIAPYFGNKVMVMVNGKQKNVEYIGAEIEADVIYLYYQVTQIKKLKILTMENRILTDLYDDQVNMVHFKMENGDLKSMRTTPEATKGTLEFD